MKAKKWAIGILVLIGLLVGSMVVGAALGGKPGKAAAAPAAQIADPCAQDDDGAEAAGETADIEDTDTQEVECGPQDENEAGEPGSPLEAEDGHESQEADQSDEVAPANTAVSADQAQAIAEAANPGATTLAVEFDRENGVEIYEVELDNGQDVKVDAGSGAIIATETRDGN